MFKEYYPHVTGNVLPVKKLYYANSKSGGRPLPGYPFKIVFRRCKTQYWRRFAMADFRYNINVYSSPSSIAKEKPKADPILIDMENSISAWLRSKYNKYPFHSEYKERFADTRTIFLQKYEDWKYLIDNFGNHVVTAERPVNNTHLQLLRSGEKLVFRKSLFWRKYRYKIGFKSTPNLYQNGLQWLESFFENKNDDEFRFNHNMTRALKAKDRISGGVNGGTYKTFRRRYYYYGHNIFLNNKENIVMLKLGMNHSIHSIEQCMTFNEIENFEKELESEN